METVLVLKILNMIQAGFGWLAERGVQRDRAQALIDRAVAENRDVRTAEVQAELDATQAALDETADAIDRMPGGDEPE
jgi:uncharacterized membrane protein